MLSLFGHLSLFQYERIMISMHIHWKWASSLSYYFEDDFDCQQQKHYAKENCRQTTKKQRNGMFNEKISLW